MKEIKKFTAALLAGLMLAACFTAFTGCAPKENALDSFEEVAELNKNSKLPYPLGTYKADLKKGYEYSSGAEGHYETFRSSDNVDAAYYLSTREFYYGTDKKADRLYVTGVRLIPKNREVKKRGDGTTYTEYTTSWKVLGIKIGDNIADAEKTLEKYGYTNIIRETPKSNLPQTLEYTYSKGIVQLTLGVETNGGVTDDISQILVRIPYDISEIDSFCAECTLPANLGSSYNVTTNEAFTRDKDRDTGYSRAYVSSDGSNAVLRGFPDYTDASMSAYISFTDAKYNVLGISVGSDIDDAAGILEAAGWDTAEPIDGSQRFAKGVIVLTFGVGDNGMIERITAELAESTNLTGAELNPNR